MVGKVSCLSALNHPDVERVFGHQSKAGRSVAPQNCTKLFILIFFDLAPIESQLIGYNACFFCLGVSSVGMSKEEYKRITYDLTLNVGQLLAKSTRRWSFATSRVRVPTVVEQGRVAPRSV